jgi:ATP-binding cassette subfamily B (MDR/TAP) protein 9
MSDDGEEEGEDNKQMDDDKKEVLSDLHASTLTLNYHITFILIIDLIIHISLLIWYFTDDGNSYSGYLFQDSPWDLIMLDGVKNVLYFILWKRIQKFHEKGAWASRRKLRNRIWDSKGIVLFTSVVYCNFALGKCLKRLISGIPDKHEMVPHSLFWTTITLFTLTSMLTSYAFYSSVNGLFTLAQEHRRDLRKRTRELRKVRHLQRFPAAASASTAVTSITSVGPSSSALVAPLLAQQGENEAGIVADLSDHPSDDDSSSDEDDEIEAELNNTMGHVDSKKARAQERRQREREQKRQQRSRKQRKMAATASFSQLLSLASPDFWYFVVAFIALVVAAFSSALIPHFTGQVINHVAGADPDRGKFEKATIYLTCVGITCGIFTGLRGSIFTLTMARMDVRARRALFANLLTFEMGYFDKTKVGEIISRLSSDTTKMSDQISLNINVFLRSIMEAAIVLALMFRLSWQLSLLSLAAMPIMTLISELYGSFYRRLTKKAQDALADTSSVAEEALGSMSTVKDFSAKNAELKAYEEELDRYYQLNRTEALAYAGFTLTWTTIPSLVTALTLFYGGKLVLDRDPDQKCGTHGHLCGGDLVSFMLYQQSLSNSLEALGSIMGGMASALGAADKVLQLLNRVPEVRTGGKIANEPFISSVELKNVVFSYPSRPNSIILQNFNLRVEQGEIVALVGPSGGGKSSIVRLIEHHYQPAQGAVYVGERLVADYEPGFLHRRMSTVGQEPTLFARSIRRNIIYGLEGEQDEPALTQVIEASKFANAHEFIMGMPKGYSTHVGERGVQLSGGQ